jgi:hypothetical protein
MTYVEAPSHVETLLAGWHPDPEGQHQLRYFDGRSWTGHVTHFGPTPCSGCGGGDR